MVSFYIKVEFLIQSVGKIYCTMSWKQIGLEQGKMENTAWEKSKSSVNWKIIPIIYYDKSTLFESE